MFRLEAQVCGEGLVRTGAPETPPQSPSATAPPQAVEHLSTQVDRREAPRRRGRSEISLSELIHPARPRLVMFGAGHVGQAVARAFAPLPFHLDWPPFYSAIALFAHRLS